MLEETALPVEGVARQVGFGSATAFRGHFRKAVGIAPATYRARFEMRCGAG